MNTNYSALLDENIERGRKQDKPLINFFILYIGGWVALYLFAMINGLIPEDTLLETIMILSFFPVSACYFGYLIYIKVKRVNTFIARKTEWYTNVVDFTNQYSADSDNLTKLNELIDPKVLKKRIKAISIKNYCMLWLVGGFGGFCLVIAIGVGIQSLSLEKELRNALVALLAMCWAVIFIICDIIIYENPINAIWNKVQYFENEFDNRLSTVWKENGWIEKPIEFYIDPSKRRPFFLWIFFTMITFGVAHIIREYKVHTDPDNMYYRFHNVEDQILDVIEKIEQ